MDPDMDPDSNPGQGPKLSGPVGTVLLAFAEAVLEFVAAAMLFRFAARLRT